MHRFFILIVLAFLSLSLNSCEQKREAQSMKNTVTIKTNLGDMKVELYPQKAPETVANFLSYVDEKFYDHTIFHRVIDGFMVQGGGFDKNMKQKTTHAPIKNEASNGVSNQKGTIAMARTSDVHSATSQFFINVADNTFLDYKSSTPSGYGYCVFGKVTEGLDVLDKIKKVKTGSKAGHQDVPVETVEIISVTRD